MKASLIIMAAGQSRRMGQNKLFLSYKGQTFLEHTLELVLRLDVEERILVISSEDFKDVKVPDSIKVVINNQPEKGQSHSVSVGTAMASGLGYLYLPIDQPLLTVELVSELIEKGTSHNIVIPICNGKLSSPVFFGETFKNELVAVKGTAGGRSVRDAHQDSWQLVQVTDENLLRDIDTHKAYLELLSNE